MTTLAEQGEAAYDKTIKSPEPMHPAVAAERLRDVKRIFDQMGIVFFLGSGTCLGAIRENRFIPWDDEMDTASIIGLHGLTEETIDQGIAAFTDNGYYVHEGTVGRSPLFVGLSMVKSGIRVDWTCHRIIGDNICEYPAVNTPLKLFTHLKEISFIGEKFLVPNPPEEYLRIKYGRNWKVPKGPGFEKDVVEKIPDGDVLSRLRRIDQFLAKHVLPWRAGGIRVFNREGKPVHGAEVVVAGVGRSKTNKQGYAKLYVPNEYYYAVTVKYDDHEEILYEEVLVPRVTYVYKPGPDPSTIKHYKAGVRAMALTRE